MAQKTGTKMACPGEWKHGANPAVCPFSLILSHTHLGNLLILLHFLMFRVERSHQCSIPSRYAKTARRYRLSGVMQASMGIACGGLSFLLWENPPAPHTNIIGVPSPFFPGILLFTKPSNTQGHSRNLKRTMVENNGESTTRNISKERGIDLC